MDDAHVARWRIRLSTEDALKVVNNHVTANAVTIILALLNQEA